MVFSSSPQFPPSSTAFEDIDPETKQLTLHGIEDRGCPSLVHSSHVVISKNPNHTQHADSDVEMKTRENILQTIAFYTNQMLRTIALCYQDLESWPPTSTHFHPIDEAPHEDPPTTRHQQPSPVLSTPFILVSTRLSPLEIMWFSIEHVVDVKEFLVSDIALLEPSGIVPCDSIFISGHNIRRDESNATGESNTIKKVNYNERIALREQTKRKGINVHAFDAPGAHTDCFLVSGAKVLKGYGKYIVIAVGQKSFNGRIMMGTFSDNFLLTFGH